MNLTLIGSLALDTIKTPFGKVENALGGSALFAGIAASFFSPCGIVGVVGKDFPKKAFEILNERNIDTTGIEIKEGKTFHWEGYYDYDLNTAHTLNTELNVFAEFNPLLPESYKDAGIIFLANIDPDLQEKVLKQTKKKKLVLLDTMNYWIEHKKSKLLKVIKQSDVILLNDAEARELAKTANILKAAQEILSWGPNRIIIKKGEHGCIMVAKQATSKTSKAQKGTHYIHLHDYNIDMKAVKVLPENLIRKYKVLPIKKEKEHLIVAMTHPLNVIILDEIRLQTAMKITPLITSDNELTEAINRIFNTQKNANSLNIQKDHSEKSKDKNHKFSLFIIPAYPLEEIYDPTGAGDTFAGTLCGYLANKKELNDENFRKAIVLANVFASFTVENFSIKGLLSLTREKILQRYDDYKEIVTYEEESLRELL